MNFFRRMISGARRTISSGTGEGPPGSLDLEATFEIDLKNGWAASIVLLHAIIAVAEEFEIKSEEGADLETGVRRQVHSPALQPLVQTAKWAIGPLKQVTYEHMEFCNGVRAEMKEGSFDFDARLSMTTSAFLASLSDELERMTNAVGLPLRQWANERALIEAPRSDWPTLWRIGVRVGALWHLLEDLTDLQQAMMQLPAHGWLLPTRRWAGDWLTRLELAPLLLDYRERALAGRGARRRGRVSDQCASTLTAYSEAAARRAQHTMEVADALPEAAFLEAPDLLHLALHVTNYRVGGVFLSHRSIDARASLVDRMDPFRDCVFLDIWTRPLGDTNRRFLWRNLTSVLSLHAFVSANYDQSTYCLKELEAWGLLCAARDVDAAKVGRFFSIKGAAVHRLEDAIDRSPWLEWTARARHNCAGLSEAVEASAEAISGASPLGERTAFSTGEEDASDDFNQALLRGFSGVFTDSASSNDSVLRTQGETIDSFFAFLGNALDYLREERVEALQGDTRSVVGSRIEAACNDIPRSRPQSDAEMISAMLRIRDQLSELLDVLDISDGGSDDAVQRWVLGAIVVLFAVSETASCFTKDLKSHDAALASRANIYYTKWGAIVDSLKPEFRFWIDTLVDMGAHTLPRDVLQNGLVLATMPVDHETALLEVRLDSNSPMPKASDVQPGSVFRGLAERGLSRRTVTVTCDVEPHWWQQVVTVAALSSFASRRFLFVNIEGSGSLDATVGTLKMEDFPHVSVSDIKELGPVPARA